MAFSEFLLGKRERMIWVVETSYGSGGALTSGEVVGDNCIIEPDFKQGFQDILSAGADSMEVENRVPGPKMLPYTMLFAPVNWRWMKYLMTCVNGADGATKTHTFTLNNSITSYKLEWAKRHTTSHVLVLTGNTVKSATLSFTKATGEGTEGFLKVSLGCVAKDHSQSPTPTILGSLTLKPFQYRHIKFTIEDTEVVEVNNGEITIERGIDENDSRYCNSTLAEKLGEPIPKIFRVKGRINVNLKDKTFYDLWNARAEVGTTIETATASGGSTSTLIDTGIGWDTDEHLGKNVEITSGTGAGQIRRIESNTTDTLTVSDLFTTAPDATSVYKIVKVNKLLIDRDGTGNDQMEFTFTRFFLVGAIAPTSLEGITNVDLFFTANISHAESRDLITTY